jgi:hypothetical protein
LLSFLFAALYNVVFFGGVILGLTMGSWWPVVILCPVGVFVLPRVLASITPLVAVSGEQVRRARRINLLLVVAFLGLVLLFGLISDSWR